MLGAQVHFWGIGCLIGAVGAGEVFQLAPAGLGIQALHIALFAFSQRRFNKNLRKFFSLKQAAGHGEL